MRRSARLAAVALLVVGTGGCAPAVTDPGGPAAARSAGLFWGMLAAAAATFVLVAVLVAVGAVRSGDEDPGERGVDRWFVIGGGVVLPLVVLSVLMGFNMSVLVAQPASGEIRVDVVGHQYWWELRYDDFTTANELHIPVDRRVELHLTSRDVIHAFWVPRLGGKRDLVPGRENTLVIEADEPGTYRGRCAEYCGLQHGRMRFQVVAQPADEYRRWLERQRRPAREPTTAAQRRGREVFANTSCAGCHVIRGVDETGEAGPQLTHLASRNELAAGVLENTRHNLRRFVREPQQIKRGVRMPPQAIRGDRLDALVAYLDSLE